MNDALGQPESVLLLGGGSEIGRALLARLTRARRVILTGRPGSPTVAEAADELRGRGIDVRTTDMDANEPPSVVDAVDKAFAEGSDIDLVVLAFGVLGDQAAAEADPKRAIEVATVDYTSQVAAGLAASKHLKAQGYGMLVALSSVAGERVRRANFVYGSAKAGMDGFFQGIADSLVGTGVRVMIVRPGFVTGRMTAGMEPAPLATNPPAVADAILRGLARGDAVVYVPPVLRHVFRVFRHLPRAAWRRMPR